MNFFIRLITFFLLIPFCVMAEAPHIKNFDNLLHDLDAYTEKTHKDWQAPGVAVIVVHKGKPYYILKGTKSALHPEQRIDEQTRFQIMSLTKSITAALMIKLAEQNLIALDDPVIKYIPDFKLSDPKTTQSLTIGHILSQSTGLRHFAGDSFLKLGFSEKEIWSVLAKLPVHKQFGKDYTYSNHFFGLMRVIVEKVTGRSFEKVAQEFLFAPLHMNATSYLPQTEKGLLSGCGKQKQLPKDFAKPHVIRGGITELPFIDQAFTHMASMGVSSSVSDMGKWLQFLMYNHPAILKQDWFARLRAPQNHYVTKSKNSYVFPKTRMDDLGYCYGMIQTKYGKDRKVTLYTHNGAWIGGTTRIAFVPELDIGIIVLCNLGSNQDCMAPEAITFKFLDMALGIHDTDWSTVILKDKQDNNEKYRKMFEQDKYLAPYPHEDITPYIGAYDNPLYGTLSLKIKSDGLWLGYRNKWARLKHLNGNRFQFDAYQLTEGYSSNYYAFIDFGYSQERQSPALTCNIMNEGDDTLFLKKCNIN